MRMPPAKTLKAELTWMKGEFALGNGSAFRWSGRTQRDAIIEAS